jgi:hypothetical protein
MLLGELRDRRNVFSYCLKRLVLLIMIGDFPNRVNFPSVPRFHSFQLPPVRWQIMDLTHLSISLGDMLRELDESGIWGHVRSLVIHENWAGIAEFYGNEFAETVKRLVNSIGMEESLKLLEKLSKEDADKLSGAIKQALKNASSFQLRGSLGEKLIQFHNRDAHGIRQSALLAAAFADRLTDLVFPARMTLN